MIGEIVGSYRVVRALGKGGMGAVYLAEHTAERRFAAIKMLEPRRTTPDDVRRFFDEARAATAIDDPGIVQVEDTGFRADGSPYIVMEALVGEPLDRRLHRFGRVPATAALRIVRQLASTLQVAHAAGLVHGDLRPESVFLAADASVDGGERARLLDFGCARLAKLGTALYMAPEQCRGAAEVDRRADIYGLGCMLYHLLVGRPPFVAAGGPAVMTMHLRDAVTPPSVVLPMLGGAVDMLVMRCLAKAPDERYATMAEVVAEIDRRLLAVAAAEARVAFPAPQPQRRILRWWRRRRGLDGGVPG